MPKVNKYTYYYVIQQNWNGSWDDADFYECKSNGQCIDEETNKSYKENLKLYRTEGGAPVRVIFRKELNKDE